MGKYNSSIYRVRPLMQVIEQDYSAFLKVLSLVGIDQLSMPGTFRYDGEKCTEMQLKPTKTHLMSLIDYLAEKTHPAASIKGQDRRNLFYGSLTERKETSQKAKDELENNYDRLSAADRLWYMFEGFTNPDIFIEGDDYVIVCEGKWTEPHITTTTTYLSSKGEYRNQMIRHIQGALNYTDKKVYAFYIVDANCGYTNELTEESFCKQLNHETIPLEESEKKSIAESYCGYTTWQDIKALLPNVIFKEKREI